MSASTDFMAEIAKSNEALKNRFKKREATIKPAKGKTTIRLLPGWNPKARGTYHRDFAQHYVKDMNDALVAVVPCANHIHGQDCPVCNSLGAAIRATTDDEQIKQLEKSKPSATILLNVLHLDGENPNEPVILEVRPSVMKAIVELMEDWQFQIFSPDEGQPLVINREGAGLLTKYSVTISPKKVPYNPATVIPKLHDLDEYASVTYEQNTKKALGFLGGPGLLPKTSRPSLAYDEGAAARRDATVAASSADFTSLDDELASLDDLV